MAKSLIADVSDTAFWVANYRAEENERVDALFHDHLACRLIGEKGPKISRWIQRGKYVSWTVIIRTCIIDNFITNLVEQEGVTTVLNLGCGLDTRPYRMTLPGLKKWIEVDYPHVIELKEKQLANELPLIPLERIKLDLTNIEKRRAFFHTINSSSEKVLVLTEGVVPYLSTEQAGLLADDILKSNHFSYWILEYFAPKMMEFISKKRGMTTQMRNAPLQFSPREWYTFFRTHGWVQKEIKYLSEESERLGRPIPAPWWVHFIRKFVKPKFWEEYKRFSGYTILIPAEALPRER